MVSIMIWGPIFAILFFEHHNPMWEILFSISQVVMGRGFFSTPIEGYESDKKCHTERSKKIGKTRK